MVASCRTRDSPTSRLFPWGNHYLREIPHSGTGRACIHPFRTVLPHLTRATRYSAMLGESTDSHCHHLARKDGKKKKKKKTCRGASRKGRKEEKMHASGTSISTLGICYFARSGARTMKTRGNDKKERVLRRKEEKTSN